MGIKQSLQRVHHPIDGLGIESPVSQKGAQLTDRVLPVLRRQPRALSDACGIAENGKWKMGNGWSY